MSTEGIGVWRASAKQRRAAAREICGATLAPKPRQSCEGHVCGTFKGHAMTGRHVCRRCAYSWPMEGKA